MTKHGEFTKGPWTISQYGATVVGYDANNCATYRYGGSRYTINEIGVDVHPIYDAGGRKKEYPDGVIMRPEDVREVVALLRMAPDLRDALRELIAILKGEPMPNDKFPRTQEALKWAQLANAELVLALATTPVGVDEGVPK